MRVAENIYLVDGAEPDCNVYLIDNELMIDTGSGLFLDQTVDQMERFDLNPEKVRLIALTHAHFCHVGAVAAFKDLTNAKVGIHEEDMEALETGEGLFHSDEDLDYGGVRPDMVLSDGEELKTDNYKFEILHTPGHTPGSVSFWEPEEKILITGDLVFLGDIEHEMPEPDGEALESSLQRIKELDIDILLPGHGMPGNRNNPWTGDVIDEKLEEVG